MSDSEIVRPTPERESVEAPSHHADEPGQGETHDPTDLEPAGGVDMGIGVDVPQELPGMEVDMIAENDSDLKDLVKTLTPDAKEEVLAANQEIMSVIRTLGGDSQKYKRERSRAMRAVLSKVYSPPRVTAAIKLLPELRLIPGFALDLTTADSDGFLWDFDSKVMRERAMR